MRGKIKRSLRKSIFLLAVMFFLSGKDAMAASYSDWSTTYPSGKPGIESKIQYRYSDYVDRSGWKKTNSGSVTCVPEWPSGFDTSHLLYKDYAKTPVTSMNDGKTKRVVTESNAGYIYWHWCRNDYQKGPINRFVNSYRKLPDYTCFHAFKSNVAPTDLEAPSQGPTRKYANPDVCKDTYWFFPLEIVKQNYTDYTWDHSGSYWSSWSGWSDTPYKASSTRKVEKRTVYRYKIENEGQWLSSGGYWWYRHADGSCTKDGWEKIGDYWYHFDANGWMQTGWIYIENNWYYLGNSGAAYCCGWNWIDGYCYYFYDNGSIARNTKIDGCYVDWSGKWVKDQWINSGGYWWYRHGDGSCTKDGWEKIGDYWYHFDSAGWMQVGWIYIKNNWYYLDESGKRCEGGWTWIGGECYYFHSNGKMACDTTIDGKYVDGSGKAQVDKWVNSGGYWWYRHKDGSCTKNGWEKIGGYWYHFDSAGWMQTGWIYVENNWYYLNGSGQMCTGWIWVGNDSYYLYSDGSMARDTYVGEYYVDSSGHWLPNGKYGLYIGTLQYLERTYGSQQLFVADYSVYDIDKDGTKELIYKFFPCEAGAQYWIYTIKNGAVEYVGYFWGSHSSLMTSSECAVYKVYGHMGHMEIYSVYYSNGEFWEEQIYSEEFGGGSPNPNPRPDLLADEKRLETSPANDYSLLQ